MYSAVEGTCWLCSIPEQVPSPKHMSSRTLYCSWPAAPRKATRNYSVPQKLAQLPLPLVAPCCVHMLPCGCRVIAADEAAKAAQAAAIAALAAAT